MVAARRPLDSTRSVLPEWLLGHDVRAGLRSCALLLRKDNTVPRYTNKQGKHLTYTYYYTTLHGRPPAESEMQQYFKVAPPSQHQMILTLEKNGLITRVPGVPRSIRLSLTRAELVELLSSLLLETGEDGLMKK